MRKAEIYIVIPYVAPEIFQDAIFSKEPEITIDTPECFANLMKSRWDSDLLKRPSIAEIKEIIDGTTNRINTIETTWTNEKQHPGAIYTSRPIKSHISQVSSFNSSSTISNQVYTSEILKDKPFLNLQGLRLIKSSSGYISNDLDF
ncbi:kinase-like domain-containing protein [Rhizophagus irregularis DAOM 181602=DAOM 197198]|uniref:Serine-threonine/tyrosine-protein kinase catalytic domain-containing protein n=1 Tax=Rhizophagus irregularis (strain DAOM 181602 / DAOM 197198 / MUCL 43194) TaxID=747089 RepID=A0A2P4PD35_RHIID|nr:hypothetical protein GLOIN_2v1882233 [Rhizophagus irregularis DAOM 181602=DAOM 197198]POG63285.1 hypothetical protein GLOIN_2v1882233 [Rhizophagus irregularis DAOM 181602=DAOM 197198]GBC29149.2 kinase-like domain-containing protein [Rhizophagus irregularis DAOM 181602=DAOM 197198]|eukprot:XP_025170151.1 hypothetical protein GLOIN_2v1882233 [Rhizophagus irregularis DAOM 181602=DAOM 197198]